MVWFAQQSLTTYYFHVLGTLEKKICNQKMLNF